MTTTDFMHIVDTLPKQPGIYKFVDEEGTILYIGKAKNLKSRVSSYFGERKGRAHRTRVMVKNANHIAFTIVETESDALLLENALIKKHQPRYNVMLKDGKSYSYICVKKEPFPRVFITRKVRRDGSTYFGPYTSKARLKVILELIKNLFPLRTCSLPLSQKNIAAAKFKVCLEYHIKNCLGPCVGKESKEEYDEKIIQVKNVLKGNFGAVKQHFTKIMQSHAEQLEFEKAEQIKNRLTAFENYQSKSTVVSTSIKDVDVFSIATNEKEAYVNYLKAINGAIIHTHTQEVVKNLDENELDILAYTIPILRERFNSIAPEIILSEPVPVTEKEIVVTVPKIGDKKKLLELSRKNVQYYLLQKKKDAINNTRKQTSAERILRTLKEDLNMDRIPHHIECFDNSNIQGTNPVAACVVFKKRKNLPKRIIAILISKPYKGQMILPQWRRSYFVGIEDY